MQLEIQSKIRESTLADVITKALIEALAATLSEV